MNNRNRDVVILLYTENRANQMFVFLPLLYSQFLIFSICAFHIVSTEDKSQLCAKRETVILSELKQSSLHPLGLLSKATVEPGHRCDPISPNFKPFSVSFVT